MLEEKLEDARLRSAKSRKKTAIVFLVTIVFCGIALFGLSSFDFSTANNVPASPSEVVAQTEEDLEKIRDEFIEKLQQYKNELAPRLQATNARSWNRGAFSEINVLENKAMSSFSSGNYSNALGHLQALEAKTVKILAESKRIFEVNMKKAASFLAEDRYDEAKLHIEKALTVASQSPEALSLQEEIEKLQHILPLLDEVKVARAERDMQKEYNLLQQILQIAPQRKEASERLKLLGQQIKDKKFDTHISAGFAEIKNKQTQKARHHYQKAKKADPGRKELGVLLGQVSEQEKTHRVQQAVKMAEQAVSRDDWQQAKISFTEAIKDAPKNKVMIEGLKRANEVLGLQTSLSQHIKNPSRLANSSVLSEAEKTLMQAKHAASYSLGIKRQAEQLRELITNFNRLIPVTITSDDKTYILIRRVGKVGVLSNKTIELKPGNYTFEGTRDGYKSKLLQVIISHNQDNFSIHLICDEPI